jgi:hypothetical protein
VIESILNYSWETWTVNYKLKKKILNTEIDYWRRAARTSRLLQGRNKVITKKWERDKQLRKELKTT